MACNILNETKIQNPIDNVEVKVIDLKKVILILIIFIFNDN